MSYLFWHSLHVAFGEDASITWIERLVENELSVEEIVNKVGRVIDVSVELLELEHPLVQDFL